MRVGYVPEKWQKYLENCEWVQCYASIALRHNPERPKRIIMLEDADVATIREALEDARSLIAFANIPMSLAPGLAVRGIDAALALLAEPKS